MRSPTAEEWARLEPLLDAAVEDGDPQGRDNALAACGPDAALRAWVAAFVDGARAEAFPATLDNALVAAAVAREAGTAPDSGARFGPWRVIREIGRGGMGAVFLAERADGQFEQQVAIKLHPRGLGLGEAADRFLRERQILARLDHPNVARLVDGGVTDGGQPWFAMEYVPGEAIDQWCDRQRLPVPARLRLFLQVCEAVQAAHQRLIIHRDLKPSNILVTADGTPRLLDFGIAKLLDDGDASTTRTGLRTFTPEYASPEQWRGEPVTTASDVYSLGVLLYELLCGRRPHDLRTRPEGEWAALVTGAPVRPPSALVTPGAAASRASSVGALQLRLREELDVIVGMAMRQEPERRYQTVDQLASDVRRHLDGLPVRARTDTWRYRTRKFVSRNRTAVTGAVLVALSLLAGAVGTTVQARRASAEAERASAARAFLAGMFAETDPYQARGDRLTAGDMLDRAVARLDSVFARQPEVRADLMIGLGEIYRNLGRLEDADSLLSRALPLIDSLGGDSRTLRPTALTLLGSIRMASGALESADTLARAAVRAVGPSGSAASYTAYTLLANVRRRRYDFAGSDSLFRIVRRRMERDTLAPDARAIILNDHGMMLLEMDRYTAAESTLRQALALPRSIAPNDPGRLTTLAGIAQARDYLGDKESAATINAEVLRLQRQNYPNGHENVAVALNNLAFNRLDRGDFAAAESLFTEASAMLERINGPGHLPRLITWNNAGRAALLVGDARRAEGVFREVLATARQSLGDDHGFVSQPLHWVARALLAQGRLDEAWGTAENALARAARTLPEGHGRFTDLAEARGLIAAARGQWPLADSLLARSLVQRAASVGAGSVEGVDATVTLARVRAAMGRPADADSLYRDALATLDRHDWLAWRARPVRAEVTAWRQRVRR